MKDEGHNAVCCGAKEEECFLVWDDGSYDLSARAHADTTGHTVVITVSDGFEFYPPAEIGEKTVCEERIGG